MGYRRAARQRRTQFVRGHYRKGRYVRPHIRNKQNSSGLDDEVMLYGCLVFWGIGGWLVAALLTGGEPVATAIIYLLPFGLALAIAMADKKSPKD